MTGVQTCALPIYQAVAEVIRLVHEDLAAMVLHPAPDVVQTRAENLQIRSVGPHAGHDRLVEIDLLAGGGHAHSGLMIYNGDNRRVRIQEP